MVGQADKDAARLTQLASQTRDGAGIIRAAVEMLDPICVEITKSIETAQILLHSTTSTFGHQAIAAAAARYADSDDD